MKILLGLMLSMNVLNVIGLVVLKHWSECVDDELEMLDNITKEILSGLHKEENNRRRASLSQENKINYSNYRNCLLALAEYDPKLKEYLEKNKK